MTIILAHADGEYRETFWITNKNGDNFFIDKNDAKKKVPLPGFTIIDDLCLVSTNKPLAQQPAEDKVMNIYDVEAKEMPKSVPMLVNLIGKQVTRHPQGGPQQADQERRRRICRHRRDPRGEHHRQTLSSPVEPQRRRGPKGIQTATFYGAWVEKNQGVTEIAPTRAARQKGRVGRPNGAPPKAGESAPKTASLFGTNV